MQDRDIVRMANQIAGFFTAYPEERAVAETAAHIRSFWDPRMRAALIACTDAGGSGLDAVVVRAVDRLRPAAAVPPAVISAD